MSFGAMRREVQQRWVGGVSHLGGRQAGTAREGSEQFRLLAARQRRRKQNGAAAEGGVDLEQTSEQILHIGVGGVHLVDHQHLAGETPKPQRLVPRLQNAEQGLVDGTHSHLGQKSLLATIGEPGRAKLVRTFALAGGPPLCFGKLVEPQVTLSVRQHQRGIGVVAKELAPSRGEAVVHGIGGRHGRQAEIKPFGLPRRHQAMRQREGRFGFAAACDLLDHDKLRAGRKWQASRELLQRCRLISRPQIGKGFFGRKRLLQQTRLLHGALRGRQCDLFEIVPRRVRGLGRRKKLRIRAQPIGQDGEAGKKPGGRPRAILEIEFVHLGRQDEPAWKEKLSQLGKRRVKVGSHGSGKLPQGREPGILDHRRPAVVAHGGREPALGESFAEICRDHRREAAPVQALSERGVTHRIVP